MLNTILQENQYSYNNLGRYTEAKTLVIEQVLSGKVLFSLKGKEFIIEPGQTFIYSQNEESSYRLDSSFCDSAEIRYINLTHPPSALSADKLREKLGPVFVLEPESEPELRFKALISDFDNGLLTDRFKNSERCYAFLMSLIAWHSQEQTKMDPFERAREWILDNYTRPISTKEIAYEVGISREHLTREFKQRFGESPRSMLNNLRMGRALQLLKTTTIPIDTVASKSGFSNAPALVRHCKARFSDAPNTLRQRAQKAFH